MSARVFNARVNRTQNTLRRFVIERRNAFKEMQDKKKLMKHMEEKLKTNNKITVIYIFIEIEKN